MKLLTCWSTTKRRNKQCESDAFPSATNLRFHRIQTVDSWIRDYGPNFLINGHGDAAFNDWIFNAWGNKYETLKQDDRIPRVLEPGG